MVTRVMPQSLLFPVDEWSRTSVVAWLRSNGFSTGKVTKEANHFRARQFDPGVCRSYGTKIWRSRRDAAGRGRRNPKKILAVYCNRNLE
jgi:hypothetical protein